MTTEKMYPIYTPSPIVSSKLVFVGLQYMEEKYRRFFLDDSDVAGINWAQGAFRAYYNHHIADEDYYIQPTEDVLDAALPPMIPTIDLVGDDELELSWPEFVEYQSGFKPSIPGAEILSGPTGRMKRIMLPAVEDNTQYVHYERMFNHSVTKNHVADQGGVLLQLIFNWGNPLVTDNEDSAQLDINRLTNRDDWIIRPLDEESALLGKLSNSEAAINLFEGGDIYVPDTDTSATGTQDVDPDTFGGGDEDTGVDESSRSEASAESDEFKFWVEQWFGGSVLTDINFF